MKIRNGFVSNSSSSSFCIYGTTVDHSDILKEKAEDEDTDDMYEQIDDYIDRVSKAGLEGERGPDGSDCIYIGRSWSTVEDNETGKQFRTDVEEKIEKLLGKKVECETMQEAWHD